MGVFGRPLCWLRGVWYTIKTSNIHDFTPVDGHSFAQVGDTRWLECENCGKLMKLGE